MNLFKINQKNQTQVNQDRQYNNFSEAVKDPQKLMEMYAGLNWDDKSQSNKEEMIKYLEGIKTVMQKVINGTELNRFTGLPQEYTEERKAMVKTELEYISGYLTELGS